MRDDPTCSICNSLNLTELLFISDMAWLHLRFRRLITAILIIANHKGEVT